MKHVPTAPTPQDELYRPRYELSLLETRELTLRRLQKFVQQRFFSVFDYTRGACARTGLFWRGGGGTQRRRREQSPAL